MTGYTVHTGSSEAFSENFDKIFGTKKAAQKPKRVKKKTVQVAEKAKRAPRKG